MATAQNQYDQRSAKALAGLMLIQMALGLLLNFYFLKPVLHYDGVTATKEVTFILGWATLVALIISAINIAFGLLLPQEKTKEHWKTLVFLIVFATVGLALCANEYARLAEYISFMSSQSAVEPNAELLATALVSGRNEAHFLSIFVSSCSLVIFYILMLQAKLIHKQLSYFALVAALLQLVAIGHTFFQMPIPNILQLPLLLAQLFVPIYLLVSGFKKPQALPSAPSESAM